MHQRIRSSALTPLRGQLTADTLGRSRRRVAGPRGLCVITNLSPQRREFLSNRNAEFLAAQPRLRLLRRSLLAIAGQEVVLEREPNLEALLVRAEPWRAPAVVKIGGLLNRCHENVARFYLRGPSKRRIVRGWAFHGDDVVWRQHSWAIRNERLCESTVPALLYYGVILNDDEAALFAGVQLGRQTSSTARARSHRVRKTED